MAKATFAAGCFWGVQLRFDHVAGVNSTLAGFEGGTMERPSYRDVCTDRTGHAEAVEIDYDPAKVNYQQLIDLFFELHDPTQWNRQGPDYGSQYRSVIFFHSPEQEKAANETIARLTAAKHYNKPIVTQVVPAQSFWRAEDYHQRYLEKRGLASCHV